MTREIWRPWTIVLRGRYSGLVSPITFLRFWTRAGAQRWLDRWQAGAHHPIWLSSGDTREMRDRLHDAYVARIDQVEGGDSDDRSDRE